MGTFLSAGHLPQAPETKWLLARRKAGLTNGASLSGEEVTRWWVHFTERVVCKVEHSCLRTNQQPIQMDIGGLQHPVPIQSPKTCPLILTVSSKTKHFKQWVKVSSIFRAPQSEVGISLRGDQVLEEMTGRGSGKACDLLQFSLELGSWEPPTLKWRLEPELLLPLHQDSLGKPKFLGVQHHLLWQRGK